MKKAIIGKKIGMTQIFDENGNVIPVTVIEAGPCVVAQKKTVEKDGYNALQLGFAEVKEKHLTKAEKGQQFAIKLENPVQNGFDSDSHKHSRHHICRPHPGDSEHVGAKKNDNKRARHRHISES